MYTPIPAPDNDANRVTVDTVPPTGYIDLLERHNILLQQRALRTHPVHGAQLATDRALAAAGFGHLSVTPEAVVYEDLRLQSIIHTAILSTYAPPSPSAPRKAATGNVTLKKRVSKKRR